MTPLWLLLRFHRTCFILTIVFFLRVRSRTLCAQWTCHVLRTRLLRIPTFCITCHQLMYSYVPVPISHVFLLVPIWIVDSSPVTCLSPISPFVLSTRLFTFSDYTFLHSSRRLVYLRFLAYAFPLSSRRLVSLPVSFWTLTRLRLISLLRVFVLVSRRLLYIRVGDGITPHLQSTLQPP